MDSVIAEMLLRLASDEISGQKRKGFAPQGDTGGPFHIEGRLADGRPANMRSEAVEYERNRRSMPRQHSIIGAMFQPEQAALVEAIRGQKLSDMAATGYGWRDFPR